jgi:starch phosphorylase
MKSPLKNTKASLRESIARHLRYTLGKESTSRDCRDIYQALGFAVRDRMIDRMLETEARNTRSGLKRVYYLSMEFLMGRSLGTNLYNLGIHDVVGDVLADRGVDLEEVRRQEWDAPLGNGGLGRLAACYLDSMATLGIAGYGCGIHYEYGLFRQDIENGYQKERPDFWLARNNPWEIERSDEACIVPVYGDIIHGTDRSGRYNPMWMNWKVIIGIPHDMPICGYGGETVNSLRLYAARASSEFDMEIFNEGDYFRAVEQKIAAETVSKVLYPSDMIASGRELRLIQEYFLVACSLRDIVRRYLKDHDGFESFPDRVAIQMNDTHPSLAVAELMRILVDEHDLPWEAAWDITTRTLAYTNHTLMAEALEKWPVDLMEHVLPRHLQVIYEINARFLQQVLARWPGDLDRMRRMSLIEEAPEKRVRMAHLAVVGAHSVNGVSALHTALLKNNLLPDFNALWPERFNNKTNGVTQRRWLLKANPILAGLINRTIGDGWITDLAQLRRLEPHVGDAAFQQAFLDIKRRNKERLSRFIKEQTGIKTDPGTLFDVHAKRIHEYKRQFLKVMHIIHEYFRITEDQSPPAVPRTYLFAGKAAPGYWQAKQIIKLIHNVGQIINGDARAAEWIRVVFLPDYRVSLAEIIMPATDLSEQISTAGTEASGTGNMKFALNGALTIGTLDGANIEIRDEVGEENIYIFGCRTEDIARMRSTFYSPWEYYHQFPEIRRVMDALNGDLFCPGEPGLFRWLFDRILREGDTYFHLADFMSYLQAQKAVEEDYGWPGHWACKALFNIARMGKFSSDRAVAEYARDIWDVPTGVSSHA